MWQRTQTCQDYEKKNKFSKDSYDPLEKSKQVVFAGFTVKLKFYCDDWYFLINTRQIAVLCVKRDTSIEWCAFRPEKDEEL